MGAGHSHNGQVRGVREGAQVNGHICRSGLPWLMDPGTGEPRCVYLCHCGRTISDVMPPSKFDKIEREVRADTRQLQTIADNAAAEWRAGVC